MITVKRRVDDGYGKVHTVQKDTFSNLQVFLKFIEDDLELGLDTTVIAKDLQDYLEDEGYIRKVARWIAENTCDTHIHIDDIANPDGYGKQVDVFEIWDDEGLIATSSSQH